MKYKCAFKSIFDIALPFLLILPHAISGGGQNITNIYRDYLKNILGYRNDSVSPCDDFFRHACENMNSFSSSYDNTKIPPFLYNHQDYYDFFDSHKAEFVTEQGILVRDLYDLCKQNQKGGPRRIWLRLINDVPFLKSDHDILRKWPFLHHQWAVYENQLDLSWPELAAEFSSHGLEIFFNIFFAESTIYVTPNKDFLCPDVEAIKVTLLPLLRQRNNQIAEIVGTEIWQLCRQLKGEMPIKDINEVPDFLTDETMSKFLQTFFSRLNFTDFDIEQARKIVVDVEILSRMMTVLKSSNPRIVYNFVMWHIFQQLSALDDCFRLTDEFRNLLQVEYWHWRIFSDHYRRDVALATYLFHTTRFQRFYRQMITSSSFDRMFQKRSQRKDLNIERSIQNFAKQYLNPENYSAIYQSKLFEDDNRSFFSQLLEMRRLAMRYSFYNSYIDVEDMNFFQEFINFCILLFYRPRFHYFASYDRQMWKDSKLLYSSDGLYTAMDCLERQSRLHAEDNDSDNIYKLLEMEQVSDIFDFYTSFAEAVADYKFWLESENFALAEDFILEYFDLNSSTIMFYAVAQHLCNRNDAIYSTIINRSFMNNIEFQEAFECADGDPMNPVTKCMIKL